MNIATKLLGTILGVLILSTAISTWFSVNLTEKEITSSINTQEKFMVVETAAKIALYIEIYKSALEQLSSEEAALNFLATPDNELLRSQFTARLSKILKTIPFATSLSITNAKGLTLASTTGGAANTVDIADRKYFAEAMRGSFAVSEPIKSRATGNTTIVLAMPLMHQKNTLGIVYTEVDLKTLSQAILTDLKIGSNGYIFMVAPTGVIIGHPNENHFFEDVSGLQYIQDMLAKKNGYFEYEYNNIKNQAEIATVPLTGWLVVATAEQEDILAPATDLRNTNILTAVCTVLIMGLVVFFIVRSITKALSKCVNMAEAVSQGDLAQSLDLQRKDELGALSQALTKMVSNLKHMVEQSNQKTLEAETQSQRAMEAMREAEEAKDQADRARKEGLRLKAHVGEWGTAKDVRTAVEELELDEVQHGIAAADDESVIRFLADNKIRLNITPTSNILLGRVADMSVHPIGKLYRSGVDVTINSDDVLIFDSDVSKEYLRLYESQCLMAEELENIRKNGLKPIAV